MDNNAEELLAKLQATYRTKRKMNYDDLPLLDISGFAFHSERGEPFSIIDQQTDQQDADLQKLLRVPEHFAKFVENAQQSPMPTNELRIFASLNPVGRTPLGEIVAVACQLALGPKNMQDGRWVGFFVSPDNYPDLQTAVERKVKQYRQFLESGLSGLSEKN